MRGSVFIFLMMTCLLVLPAGSCYACGSKNDLSKTEKKYTSHKKACCSSSDPQKSCSKKKMCGHTCDGPGCSCAHGSPVFALKTHQGTLLQKPGFMVSQVNSWFFRETTPQPVYISLWAPPNIRC